MLKSHLQNSIPWIVLFLFFLVFTIRGIPNDFIDFRGDSAQYISLAQSLAQGNGYRAIDHPNNPFIFHYPPVFPMLLSFIVYFFGKNLYLMHLLIALFGCASLIVLYNVFKKYIDAKSAFLIVFFFATNWTFIAHSTRYILSEIPYIFFSSLTLLFAYYYIERKPDSNFFGICMILGLILSYFTRYVGVTLAAAIIFTVIFATDKPKLNKLLLIGIGFGVPCALWHITAHVFSPASVSKYYQYIHHPNMPFITTINTTVTGLIVSFIEGMSYYFLRVASSLFFVLQGEYSRWGMVISPFLFMTMLYGLWAHFRTNKRCIFLYYSLFYLCLLAVWPSREYDRLLLPIMPFLTFYFCFGFKKMLAFLSPKLFRTAMVFLIAFNIAMAPTRTSSLKDYPQSLTNCIAMYDWIKHNLDDQGVIFCVEPRTTYFFTNHKAIGYPFDPGHEAIWERMKAYNVKYVLIDTVYWTTRFYVLPVINKHPDRFILIHSINDTKLFELRGG